MHLVGFIVRIYHDVRSPERQICIIEHTGALLHGNIHTLLAISGFRRDVEEICALFWGITQRRVVIQYRHLGITYRYHLQVARSPGPTGCPEASVRNYHPTLPSTPDGGQNSFTALLPQTTSTNRTNVVRIWEWMCVNLTLKKGPQPSKRQENAVLHNDPPGFDTVKVSRLTSFWNKVIYRHSG